MSLLSAERAAPAPLVSDFHIPECRIAPRVHQQQHLALWQFKGAARYVCDTTDVELSEGQVLWVPASTVHSAVISENSVVFPLFFPVEETATILEPSSIISVGPEDTPLLLALHQNQSTIIRSHPGIHRRVLSVLERRWLAPAELPMPSSAAALMVARALVFTPGDDRSIVEWAKTVHTSTRSLERMFKAETGETFQAWRNHCRMRAAARLLEAGASVTSVTFRMGFHSPSSFARAFRAFHGVSPRGHIAHVRTLTG